MGALDPQDDGWGGELYLPWFGNWRTIADKLNIYMSVFVRSRRDKFKAITFQFNILYRSENTFVFSAIYFPPHFVCWQKEVARSGNVCGLWGLRWNDFIAKRVLLQGSENHFRGALRGGMKDEHIKGGCEVPRDLLPQNKNHFAKSKRIHHFRQIIILMDFSTTPEI